MGEFSELSALKSSGISLQRIMRPLIILIGLIAISPSFSQITYSHIQQGKQKRFSGTYGGRNQILIYRQEHFITECRISV
jgi:lipopolysaccharide export LptBFGC system permease protein LptF